MVAPLPSKRVSADADAPNMGLSFISEDGILRIRAEDWRDLLDAKGIVARSSTRAVPSATSDSR